MTPFGVALRGIRRVRAGRAVGWARARNRRQRHVPVARQEPQRAARRVRLRQSSEPSRSAALPSGRSRSRLRLQGRGCRACPHRNACGRRIHKRNRGRRRWPRDDRTEWPSRADGTDSHRCGGVREEPASPTRTRPPSDWPETASLKSSTARPCRNVNGDYSGYSGFGFTGVTMKKACS